MEKARGAGASVSRSYLLGTVDHGVAPRASRNTRKFEHSRERVFRLALVYVNGHWLLEPEGKRSFGPEVDIPFTCEVGDGSSSAGTHGAADECSFTTGCGHADQRAAASAASDPAEVALLVVAASTERSRGAQIVGLAIHLNSIKD